MKIGLVGCGDISGIYLKNIHTVFKDNIELVAVCDLVKEKALKAQAEYNVPKLYDTMEEMFADDEIKLILNLTRPFQHYGVSKAALLAGKHVYSEKPLGASLEEGLELVKIAEEKGLYLGGAPDTFMGAGIQTCRKLLDSGELGEVVGGRCAVLGAGPEGWHPDPDFFYQYGGGPLFDMGPYYVTALINLIGRVTEVRGVAITPKTERMIGSEAHRGKIIHVTVPTHIESILTFENGANVTLAASFNVVKSTEDLFTLYTTKGTLTVPDPNFFGGKVVFYNGETREETEYPLEFGFTENSRALGLSDIIEAIETGRAGRTTYRQTLHVLEVMATVIKSSREGKALPIKSGFKREAPMPTV